MASSIKFRKPAFKIQRKAPPKPPTTTDASILSSDRGASSVSIAPAQAWPPSAGIGISAVGILPPVSLAPMTQEELELMKGVVDAFHDPEVLDVHRSVLDTVKEFFTRKRKVGALFVS